MQPAKLVQLGEAATLGLLIHAHEPRRRIDQGADIGDIGLALAQQAGDLRLTLAELEPALDELCELERLQALALFVFDDLVVGVHRDVDERWNLRLSSELRGTQASRSEVQDEAAGLLQIRPHRYGLTDTTDL